MSCGRFISPLLAAYVTPRRFEDLLLGVQRFLAHGKEAERSGFTVHGVDVDSTRALAAGLKTVDVVAPRRKRVDSAAGQRFIVGLADLECLLRRIIGGLADNFKIAQPHFALIAKRANTGVRMVVRRKQRARFQSPLNDEKRCAPKARPKPYAGINSSIRAER